MSSDDSDEQKRSRSIRGLFGRGKKEDDKGVPNTPPLPVQTAAPPAQTPAKPVPPSLPAATTTPKSPASSPPQPTTPAPSGQKSVSFSQSSQKQQTVQVQKPPTPRPQEPKRKEKQETPLSEEVEMTKRFRFLKNVKVRFPFTGTQIPPSWKVQERYPVNSPFAYAVIAQSPLLARRYFLDEVPLTKTEAAIYSYLLDALEAELTVPREQVNPRQYFADQARKILLKY